MKKLSFILFTLAVFVVNSFSQNVPITFEVGEHGADWTWTTFENGDPSPALEIADNPAMDGINTSAKAAKFVAVAGDGSYGMWAGCASVHPVDNPGEPSQIGEFALTNENCIIKMMVYKSTIGPVGLKLSSSTNWGETPRSATNKKINEWEELSFDFSNSLTPGVGVYDQIAIHVDMVDRTVESIVYFDDIRFTSSIVAADDATLSSLLINESSVPNFNADTLDYSVELLFGTTDVPTVTPTSYNPLATIVIDKAETLSDTTHILVTAEDGVTELTYNVSFTVSTTPSSDATLNELFVSGIGVSGFSSSTFNYAIALPNGTTEVPEVTATGNYGATFLINDAATLADTTKVIVTAQDGVTTLSYKLSFSVITSTTLPIDFENGSYGFTDFDGGIATVIGNPQVSGINTSTTVAQIVRNDGAIWAGSKLLLDDEIDFSVNNTFSMKVYSPKANMPILFKLEGENAAAEVSVNTTVANQWETLSWDFTGTASDTYDELVFMFDFGNIGDGSENSTFLFDDIELYDITGGLSQISLPVDFESSTVYYEMIDFGGNETTIGADPVDASNTVGITIKTSGAATWAGTTVGTNKGFASPIPFTEAETKMNVMVYSPTAGIKVRLKAEDHNDATLTAETEVVTSMDNAWENLTFDFSKVATGTNPFNLATNFGKLSIFFNFGVEGTDKTYYWDDVKFGAGSESTGLNNSTENINIYSSNGILFVNSGSDFTNGKVEVFDMAGRKTLSIAIGSDQEQIEYDDSGIFIVRIFNENKNTIVTKKVILD